MPQSSMGEIAKFFVSIGADLKEFKAGMQEVKNDLATSGKKMQDMGKELTKKVTAPIVGIGAAAVATVSKFDDSMSKIKAISGATGKDFENMRNLAQELGSTTAFSASQAADAMSYLALAGWDANQIMAATPDMLSLASAGAMDLATAADIVSDTMSMYQMKAEDAGRAADVFAQAQRKSNTNVEQLGEAMKYAGAAANAAGMDLEKTAAVMGVLANNGLKGSSAGTTFVSMLRDMKNKAEDGAIAIGETSIALYDAQGNMRDMGKIMFDIEKATAGMTMAQKDAALGEVFMVESMKGVNIMLGAGSEAYQKLEDDMYNSAGTAKKMATDMEDNIGGAFRSMKSAIEGFMISIGDDLKGPVKAAAAVISKAALAFTKLPGPVRKAIITLALLAAAVGPVLFIVGKLAVMIGPGGAIATGFKALIGLGPKIASAFTFMLSPAGLVIAAILAIIAVGYLIYKNWDKIKAFLANTWNKIKEVAVNAWEALVEFFRKLPERIWTFFNELPSRIGYFLGLVAGTMIRFGIDAIAWVVSEVPKIIAAIIKFFATLPSRIWEWLKKAYTAVVQWCIDLGTWAKTAIPNFIKAVVSFFANLPKHMWDIGKAVVTGLWNGIKAYNNWLKEKVSGFLSSLVKGFKIGLKIQSPSKVFANIGNNIGLGLAEGIISQRKAVSDAMGDLIDPPKYGNMPGNKSSITSRPGSLLVSGSIRVEGVNDKNELIAVANMAVDQMSQEISDGDRRIVNRTSLYPVG